MTLQNKLCKVITILRRFDVRNLQKVMLACFLGGFIGALVAKNLGFFWWVGLIVGGFVGFLSYEFKAILIACKNAWKAVVRQESRTKIKKFFRDFGTACRGLLNAVSSVMIGAGLIVAILEICLNRHNFTLSNLFDALSAVCFWTAMFTLVGVGICFRDEKFIRDARRLNPFRVYFWILPKYFFISLRWLIIKAIPFLAIGIFFKIPKFTYRIAIPTVWKFIKHVFIEIHSEIRLLCGIDAAIGALIGFFACNALIGGVAGALFGGLNYEIVSKRILRLVPAKAGN
jgi:hypothetical protein